MNLAKSAATLYQNLIRVRLTEEAIVAEYGNQEMKCPVHLSIGQEAAAVGVCVALKDSDVAFSTHRCHSHYLAKGGDLNAMIAELYGKKTGCAAGLGGSMHLVDERVGMMGASAIVGGSIPLAVGAALKFKLDRLPHVAVAFFGDGASEEGVFHESMNFAALKKLPVLFVCENNGFAQTTSTDYSVGGNDIAARGAAYGMPGVVIDGQDVLAVYEAADEAFKRARAGEGPTLLECQTYRYFGHFEGDNLKYRTREEEAKFKARDCIERFRETVVSQDLVNSAELEGIDEQVREVLADAIQFAAESPVPKPEEILDDVYVSY